MTQMRAVGPMFGQFVHFLRFAPAGNDYSKSRYLTQAMRVLEVIEAAPRRNTISRRRRNTRCGHRDFPWMRNMPAFLGDTAKTRFSHTMAWVGVIGERPAVKDDVRIRPAWSA